MSKKWLLIVVLLLVLMAILIAGNGGDAAAPVDHEGIMWPVPEGWLRDRLWPTAVEPTEPVGIRNPPHFVCPDPSEC